MNAVTAPHCRTAVPGHFCPKPLRPGTPDRPKSICFYWDSSGRTAFSGNNFDYGTSIEVERTVSNNNKKRRHVTVTIIRIARDTTIKRTAKEYYTQSYYPVWSAKIKGTARKDHNRECLKQNYMQKLTIKWTATTYNSQNTVRE